MTPDHSELSSALEAMHEVAAALSAAQATAEEFGKNHCEHAAALGREEQARLDRIAYLEQAVSEMAEGIEQLERLGHHVAAALRPLVMAAASTSGTSSETTVTLTESGDTFTDLSALSAEIGRMTYYLEPLGRRRAGQRTLWAFVTGQAAKSAEAGRQGCTRQHTRAQLRPSRPEKDHAEQAPRRRRCSHVPRPAIAAPQGGEESDHAAPVGAKPFRAGRSSGVLLI